MVATQRQSQITLKSFIAIIREEEKNERKGINITNDTKRMFQF